MHDSNTTDSTESEHRSQNPICGTCYATMSERPGLRWFCPNCADYGTYVGEVAYDEPIHPAFDDLVADDPDFVVGYTLLRHEYGEDYGDSMGTIVGYDDDTNRYIIETDLDEPFDKTTRQLDRDTLLEYLWIPQPVQGAQRIPDELQLEVRKQ